MYYGILLMENLRGQDLNLRPPAYEAGELPSALPRNMRRRSGAVSRSRDLRFKVYTPPTYTTTG